MDIASVEYHRPLLEAVLQTHAPQPVDLLLVPDIASWAVGGCGNAKGNPVAMAVVDQQTKGWGILVRQTIDAERVRSVTDRICFARTSDARTLISTPETFLKHLVLHELAHLVNHWDQSKEDECDDWAFEKLAAV